MDADLLTTLAEDSPALLFAGYVVWRMGAKLDKLVERIDRLVDAVRGAPRS